MIHILDMINKYRYILKEKKLNTLFTVISTNIFELILGFILHLREEDSETEWRRRETRGKKNRILFLHVYGY